MLATAIVPGRTRLVPQSYRRYTAFVDISGGSAKDCCLVIVHWDESAKHVVVDLVATQTGRAPFNPRHAVEKFAELLNRYHVSRVHGDKFAGETFSEDFKGHGIAYIACKESKHELYQVFEPILNSGEIELPDLPQLREQLSALVWRGNRIDPCPGQHDDLANEVAGAVREDRRSKKRRQSIA